MIKWKLIKNKLRWFLPKKGSSFTSKNHKENEKVELSGKAVYLRCRSKSLCYLDISSTVFCGNAEGITSAHLHFNLNSITVLLMIQSYTLHSTLNYTSLYPFLPSPTLMCCVILPTHFEVRDTIWSNDRLHSLHKMVSYLRFSSAIRKMPGDLCTAPGIISLSPYHYPINVTDVTFGASGLWLGTQTGAGGTTTLA